MSKAAEMAKVARREGKAFDCANWLHKADELPTHEFKREVERHLTGKETEPWELIYFKVFKSQIPVIEQALETAGLMLGSDKSRGYILEMICADFLAGAPFQGAFVQAQNANTRMTFMALCATARATVACEKVPAGEYRMRHSGRWVHAPTPQTGVKIAADQSAGLDFCAANGQCSAGARSRIYQAGKLWPGAPAKDKIFNTCFTCHAFQTRMASVTRDQDGWRDRVQFMQTAMKFGLEDRLNDEQADMIAAYLAKLFGPDSVLPKSPADMPEYKDTLRPFGSEAMNIHFVEYDMPGPSRMPFSAAPGKDGYLWIPNFGINNKITRLDPKTGAMEDFPVPNEGTAAVHSAVEAPDGTVWLTEQGSDKLGVWDPKTKTVTEYQDRHIPGKLGYAAGSKHTAAL